MNDQINERCDCLNCPADGCQCGCKAGCGCGADCGCGAGCGCDGAEQGCLCQQ